MFDFKKMLISQMGSVKTEPEIVDLAKYLRDLPIFAELTEEEYYKSLNSVTSTLRESYGQSYVIESNKKHVTWFENYYKDLGVTRWDRYVDYLRNQKGFSPAVITGMKENLFKITDFIGNPNGDNFKRKGLIIGDVQSGKTANYVGLMNLATDANYRLIIVLTGTTNTLREQTQIRIEEGLGNTNTNKGVSTILNNEYNEFAHKNPVYLTSKYSDFKSSSRKNFQLSIETTNVPIVIITKKNVTALKNIYSWLVDYSKRNKNDDHIDSSILLIDDEADFASVNTRSEEDSPTAINSKIRDILELFTKSSYIGFTATPYANIFINPESNEEMYGQDLFPKDYIFVLGESDEYLGVQSIFGENAKSSNILVAIKPEKVETYFRLKHKKDESFSNLSPSMKESINLFFIANVVRDLRGDKTSHRSMLFNISRFTSMHSKIKNVVSDYVISVQKDVRLYSKLPEKEALMHPSIASIKESFDKHYASLKEKYTFEQIIKNLNEAIYRISVAIVNTNNKELNYINNEAEGERVIVIGGFALSRGLTLEGLIISYYYRNSVMYDSLLQMGRWFGYRPNYSDLCKIFMTADVVSDFKFIAMATDELKDDLKLNSKRGLTPIEFGIKVRSGQTGLIITARNKMRAGKKITARIDFNKDIIETTALTVQDNASNLLNHTLISEFIEENISKFSDSIDPIPNKNTKGLVDVDLISVVQFLSKYLPSPGSKFDSELIIKWLKNNGSLKEIEKWDIVFITGSSERMFVYGNGIEGNLSLRTMIEAKDLDGVYKSANSRLGSPTDGRFGLSELQFERVKQKYSGTSITIPQKKYLESEFIHKPVVLIYSVIPIDGEDKMLSQEYIPLLSIGIPELDKEKISPVIYTVNTLYQDIKDIDVEDE